MRVSEEKAIKVKALDEELEKVVTFNTVPCPKCKKWIIANHHHKFCQYCGTPLEWDVEGNKKMEGEESRWMTRQQRQMPESHN